MSKLPQIDPSLEPLASVLVDVLVAEILEGNTTTAITRREKRENPAGDAGFRKAQLARVPAGRSHNNKKQTVALLKPDNPGNSDERSPQQT